MMISRDVPVQSPKSHKKMASRPSYGYGASSVRDAKKASSAVFKSASSSMRDRSSESSSSVSNDEESDSTDGESDARDEKLKPVPTKPKKKAIVKGSGEEGKLMKVVSMQQSNGSFKLNGAVAKLLNTSLKDIIEGE